MPQYQGVWTLPVAARLQSTQQWATDPLYRNTTLLLQADNAPNGAQNNTFLDSSSNNFTITRNGNATQGTFTPYSLQPGWWGNYFDGTGDYLSVASATALNLSTGDLTVEGWIYMNALPAANAPVASKFNAASPYTGWTLGINSSGYPYIWFGTTYLITSISTVAIGVWHHLALVRSGTTVTLYVNGVSVGTATSSANLDNTGTLTIGIEAGNANGLNGYVSNSRIVKGTAVYTANFTPSTSPLTAITNTSLLTCQSNRFVDNSTNAFAITVTGTPSVQAFSPFAPQYQYTPSVTGGSGYFDGTGDYLSIANNAAFTLPADFTIECWIYPTAGAANRLIISKWPTEYYIFIQANNVIGFAWGPFNASGLFGGALLLSGNNAFALNAWSHVAVVRNSNTFTLYVNGVSVSTATFSTGGTDSGQPLTIGDYGSGGFAFAGYITNARIVKGTAVYTSNFTPPTAPLTAIANTSLLLNFTNAGIYDGTLKNNLETVGNAQVSTSVVKYGTGSMYFDGTGDYLTVPANAAFNFGTGDFTVEFWLYFQNSTGFQTIFDISYTTAPNLVFQASSGAMAVYMNGASTVLAASAVSNGTWNHFALVRSGTTVTLYLNGVSVSSATYSGNVGNSTSIVYVGGSLGGGGYYLNGYIDDLRITRIARYTANFTPPTVALPRQ